MFEVTILIPKASNDGSVFPPSHHEQFEAELLARFGGFTKYGEAEGGWLDAGRVYIERHAVYAVALKSIVDGAKVGEIAELAKAHYAQISIYVRYLGIAEVL